MTQDWPSGFRFYDVIISSMSLSAL